MRLYLDCCCLNRPFDDLRQERIRIEADAISAILARIESGAWELVGSQVLAAEIIRTPDSLRRKTCLAILNRSSAVVSLTQHVKSETIRFMGLGFKDMDAAHLASAIEGGADWFLSVDDALLQTARRVRQSVDIRVESPVAFLLGAREGETP